MEWRASALTAGSGGWEAIASLMIPVLSDAASGLVYSVVR